jgi:hypothetical protein
MNSFGLTALHSPSMLAPLASRALVVALLVGCNPDSGTSSTGSASESGADTSTGGTAPTTSTTSPTSNPTGDTTAGTGSATDSGTTTTGATTTADTTTTDPTATVGTSTTDATGTTMPAQTDTGSSSTTGTSTTDGTTTDASSSSGTTGAPVEPCACPDNIEVALDDGIFVLSDNSELYKFYPMTNKFESLGAFKCGNASGTFSMAVDRLGFAWVMFSNPLGKIWKLDVTNVANCTDPGYNPGQQGVNYFGMAFVSNSQFDQCDQIYGNTFDGFGGFSEGANIGDFLTVDPKSLLIKKLGKTNFNGAEVTGTGDGRVFMFGGANPAKLVEVEKATGKFLSVTPLGTLELTNAFAFSFFGGDFYMFTESDNNPGVSKVTHFDYDDSDMNGKQDLTTVVTSAPIRIVGAGVSTCAPFLPQ